MMPDIFSVMTQQCTALMGQSVLYQPLDGSSSYLLKAILDRRTEEHRAIDGVYARLFVSSADFVAPPAAGDHVTADGKTYVVFGQPEQDPAGGTWLSLREV